MREIGRSFVEIVKKEENGVFGRERERERGICGRLCRAILFKGVSKR